jgi:nitrate reductase assembly molybdenum cofactor insertion protein NarJ
MKNDYKALLTQYMVRNELEEHLPYLLEVLSLACTQERYAVVMELKARVEQESIAIHTTTNESLQ